MKKRDIIIIAALINAGVLTALFMLAFKTEEEKPISPQSALELTQVGDMQVEDAHNNPEEFLLNEEEEPPKPSQSFAVTQANIEQPITFLEEIETEEEIEAAFQKKTEKQIAEVSTKKENDKVPEKKYIEVTVKKGDSLDKIAKNNGTTIKALKEANNLKKDTLSIGQTLKVPVKKSSATSEKIAKKSSEEKKVAFSDSPEWYTIKSGDNPWKIAKQFHIKVDDLLKLNNLNEEKAKNLKIGDKIRVR